MTAELKHLIQQLGAAMPKLITRYEPPPIPDRKFDWRAYWSGSEEHHVGWGLTEEEAIADLQRLDQECAEANGRCPHCGEDELEGGPGSRCMYCGHE
jgi:hypothetical protein